MISILLLCLFLCVVFAGLVLVAKQISIWNEPERIEARANEPKEMTATEYQQWHDYGRLPERFWDQELAVLRKKFIHEEISLEEYESAQDTMLGLGGNELSETQLRMAREALGVQDYRNARAGWVAGYRPERTIIKSRRLGRI